MKQPREDDWSHRISKVSRLIEQRLDEELSLEELAQVASSSMFHFHRIFRGLTGETVRGYARRLRLEQAAYKLSHSSADLLAIALDAKYDSHEAFTRAFKRQFGCTPSSYRQGRGNQQSPTSQGEDVTMKTTASKVWIERNESRRIAYVRHVGAYDDVGQAWKTLMKWGWSKMLFKRPDTFGLCFDDPEVTPQERLRYEACMVIGEKVIPKGDVLFKTLAPMDYAVTVHAGPLSSIGDAYTRLFAHVASESIDGREWKLGEPPSLERYLTDPRKVKPEGMKTEIFMPVQR